MRTLTFLCLFPFAAIFGQAAQKYPFIHKELNRLTLPADTFALKALSRKAQALREGGGQVRVLHFGGSHVQAGSWTSAFLNAWMRADSVPVDGYFGFPYQAGKTNGQPFMRSFEKGDWRLCRSVGKEPCEPLGIAALRLYTRDSTALLGITTNMESAPLRFNEVRLYHGFSPCFSVCIETSVPVLSSTIDTVAGFTGFVLAAEVDSVVFRIVNTTTVAAEFSAYGISVRSGRPGLFLGAPGANGASTRSFIRARAFEQQCRSVGADLVILSLGVNDSQSAWFTKEAFRNNYDSLITLVRKACPDAFIVLTTTTDNYIRRRTPNKRTVAAREALLELVSDRQVAVWDMYGIMGGARSILKWNRAGLARKDRVHFTPAGYRLWGEMMFDALHAALNGTP